MFSILVITYLFLGGAGAGLSFIASLLGLLSPYSEVGKNPSLYSKFLLPLYMTSIGILAFGVLCLVADLGRFDMALLLIESPKATPLTIGAYALVITLVLSFLLCVAWANIRSSSKRLLSPLNHRTVFTVLQMLAVISSIIVMAYPGVLLYDVGSVQLWHTPWVSVLFVLSSTSCGSAMVFMVAAFSRASQPFGNTARRIMAIDAVVIALEAICFVLALVSIFPSVQSNPTEVAASVSVSAIFETSLAQWLWLGFAFAGVVVPLTIEVVLWVQRRRIVLRNFGGRTSIGRQLHNSLQGLQSAKTHTRVPIDAGESRNFDAAGKMSTPVLLLSKKEKVASIVACAGVLVGAFSLRYIIIQAGIHPSLTMLGVI